jgi:hypothetical protein
MAFNKGTSKNNIIGCSLVGTVYRIKLLFFDCLNSEKKRFLEVPLNLIRNIQFFVLLGYFTFVLLPLIGHPVVSIRSSLCSEHSTTDGGA